MSQLNPVDVFLFMTKGLTRLPPPAIAHWLHRVFWDLVTAMFWRLQPGHRMRLRDLAQLGSLCPCQHRTETQHLLGHHRISKKLHTSHDHLSCVIQTVNKIIMINIMIVCDCLSKEMSKLDHACQTGRRQLPSFNHIWVSQRKPASGHPLELVGFLRFVAPSLTGMSADSQYISVY